MQNPHRESNVNITLGVADQARQIGVAVRAQRKAQGLDQVELAKAANVAVRTLSQIEAGKPTLRLDVLLRTLNALGMELDVRTRRNVWEPVGD